MKHKILLILLCFIAAIFSGQAQQIIYVNHNAPAISQNNGTSWPNAYTNLQQALILASPSPSHPVEIWLAKGTYRPTDGTNRLACFGMKSYLAILGGFAGTETSETQRLYANLLRTVLSGDIGIRQAQRIDHTLTDPLLYGFGPRPDISDPGFADNVFNVVRAIGVSNTVLDGLVIAGGFADYLNSTNPAAEIQYMSLPGLTNAAAPNSFFTNGESLKPVVSTVAGGGIFVADSHNRSTNVVNLILNNVFLAGNYARGYGGGLAGREANVQVGNSRFENNRADVDGGGAWGQNLLGAFQAVEFVNNQAAGTGGGLHSEVIPSDRTFPRHITDAERFQQDTGLTPDQFRQIAGGAYTAYKVVPKLYTAATTSGATAAARARYLLPSHPWSKDAELLNGEKISTGGKIFGVYAYISIAVTAMDFSLMIADAFGADMDNEFVRGWMQFSYYFNTYATPGGWASLGAQEIDREFHLDSKFEDWVISLGGGRPIEEQAHFHKKWQLSFYNQAGEGVSLLQTTFRNNTAGVGGGGLSAVYDNIRVESSIFEGNSAYGDGGAISWGGWNTPILISSVFNGNRSETSESAIGNVGHCRAQILNCTIINNYSAATNGFAVGNEMGAEVQLGNCILWGNSNAAPTSASGGADIYTATKALLSFDTNSLALYNAAGSTYGDYVATCDINHCIVQSLDMLAEGKDAILTFDEPIGLFTQAEIAQKLEDRKTADENGILAAYGFINAGEGNRPGLRTTKGNSNADPLLGGIEGFSPSALSPAINAGNNRRLNNGIINSWTDLDVVNNPRLVGTAFDIGAVERPNTLDGTIVFVRTNAPGSNNSGTNWFNAMTNLQQALSLSNRIVFVAEGTYRPSSTGDRFASFSLGENMQVYGGFKSDGSQTNLNERNPALHQTILSGDIGVIGNDSDNSYSIIRNHTIGYNTILDGFTITKGRADGGRSGGGIFNQDSEPQIVNCRFVDNRADASGGAIYNTGARGSEIIHCAFINNQAGNGGGALKYLGDLRVENSVFENNRSSIGGAINAGGHDYTSVYNSLFVNNSVSGDIFGAKGGAIDASDTNLRIHNSTFHRNYISANIAESRGGGAVNYYGYTNQNMILENNIFWNNFVANTSAPSASIEKQQIAANINFPQLPTGIVPFAITFNNIIEGLQHFTDDSSVGNLDVDPQFVDAAGGNLSLAGYSQAINAGRDRVLQGMPGTDFAGNTRYFGRIDIGAYEFQGDPISIATDIDIVRHCSEDSLIFALAYSGTNGPGINFQWQENKNDGAGFVYISNGGLYSGVTTTNLTITNPSVSMNGYRYRVIVSGAIGLTSEATFITVKPNRFYVREGGAGIRNGSSWSNAFANVHEALAAAQDCAQIWVAAGTYHPPTGPFALDNALRMRSGIGLYGGFAGYETNLNQRDWRINVTAISGNLGNPFSAEDDSATLIYNLGNQVGFACDETAILDGFTLHDARDTAMINQSASPTIRHCAFINNQGSTGGAVRSENGSPTFLTCEFRNNLSGVGGAAYLKTATNGFINCLFHRNLSGHLGGAIAAFQSTLNLRNNTLADNQASTLGGGIYLQGTDALMRNSIVWGNGHGDAFALPFSSQIHSEGASGLSVSNSVLQFGANTPGNNLGYDPLFTNAPAGDLRLLAQSPAVNTGNNANASGWSLDLAGNSRINGGTVDAGAYEYQGGNPSATVLLFTQPASVSVCTGSDPIQFTVSGVNNAALIFDWEVSNPNASGFTAISNNGTYAISATASNSTLTITNPTPGLSGNLYRAVVRNTGYATPSASLTVNVPTPLFVRWNASGANNGSSWFNAFTNLHDALNVATPCNEIWVAMGTNRSSAAFFQMHPGVAVFGGFIGFESSRDQRNVTQNQTVLLANTNQSLFVNNSIYHGALNRNAILDGFILRSANAINPVIYNVNANASIKNCTFDAPGGTAIYNQFAGPLITNCTFVNGRAVAIFNSGSSPVILESVFRGNTNGAAGGAIANYSSSPLIDHCRFETNSALNGGAIINSGASSPTISRSIFLGNRARSGSGAVANQSSDTVRIENSLFAYNESDHLGGAIDQSQGSLTLLHVTVTENHSANGGGGLYLYGGSSNIRNSILWNNTVRNSALALTLEAQQLGISSGTPTLASSCIQGNQNYSGNGNNAFDPLFSASAVTNTFPLDPASPALNAGNNAFSTNLTVDLAGTPRLAFGMVDMGAYESPVGPQNQVQLLNTFGADRVCSGDDASFSIVAAPSQTNALQWQVDAGSGFTNVVNGGTHVITVNGGTNTLLVVNANSTMNGRRYRVQIAASAFSSRPLTLAASAPIVLYVKAAAVVGGNGSSWANAFTNLQQALNVADHCSEIWVAQGTYLVFPSVIGENYFPLKPSVEIYGGFFGNEVSRNARNPAAYPTILRGQAGSPTTLMARGDLGNVDATTVLDGVVVEAMNGDGIFNYQASPAIRNCTIRNVPGAAIWNEVNSRPQIENCTFTGNQRGGIENRSGSSPTITACLFANNHHPISGGAIANVFAGNPVVTSCVFSNNTAAFNGGAIYSDNNSAATIRRSRFVGNIAPQFGGALHLQSDTSVLEQLVMHGNSASRGGAISHAGGTLNLVNSTVVDNFASIEGSGIYVQSGSALQLQNSIIWDNAISSGTHTASNSWIQGSVADPLFINPLAGDYRLSEFSPLINAGINGFVTPTMAVDFAGNPRINQSTVDIGAYELQAAAQPPLQISAPPSSVLSGCSGNVAMFSVAGTISGTNVYWQTDLGSGFSDAIGAFYSVAAISNSSALTISGLPAGANYQVRYRLAGNAFTSSPVQLVISTPIVRYVNQAATGNNTGTTWANAFTNLQAAMESSDCMEIWVAAGTYAATGSEPYFRMRSTVALYGGFNATETLRTERNWTNVPTILTTTATNSAVIFNSSSAAEVNASAILDGFVITGLKPFATMMNFEASPTIRNCSFSDRPSYAVFNNFGQPTFSNCTFSNNHDTAVYNLNVLATFIDCRFASNRSTYSGAAIVNRQSTSTVQRCVFEDNSSPRGGAVANLDGGRSVISQSRFTRNFAGFDGGAIYNSQGSATVCNSAFTDNGANSYGGALCQYGGSLELVNCTITGNRAASLGGGLCLQAGSAQVNNAILWDNTVTSPHPGATLQDAQVQNDGGTLTASNCIIQGLTTSLGANNQNADPLFGFGTLLPGAFSPAIDRGNNGFLQSGGLDLAGNPRQVGSFVDIGAFESTTSYSNALYLAQFPQPVGTCDGNLAEFKTVAASGTNYSIQWQRSSGGPFSNLVSGGAYNISTNGAENRLQLSPASTGMNGDQFRFVISSINYTSPAVTLSVGPASVIYVNQTNPTPGNGSSWAQAVTKLSDALNSWSQCSEIWVAAGTYVQTNAAGAPISLELRSPMRIYGAFAGTETNRNQRNWSNNVTRIVAGGLLPAFDNNISSEVIDRLAVLDGLVFSGAQATAVGNTKASPTFRNCTFTSNVTAVINRNGSAPLFENCSFLNHSNFFGGAVFSSASSPVFSNCVFAANFTAGRGGALSFVGGGGTIVASRFEYNRAETEGGAISVENDGNIDISRSSFTFNTADDVGGAIRVINSSAVIGNCLFGQNHSSFGGGAVMQSGSIVSVINSTLAGNQTEGNGGGIGQIDGTLGVTNSIMWGNTDLNPNGSIETAQIRVSGGAASVSHSIVAGLQSFAGNNNTGNDPLFTQTSTGNYRLQSYSSALNSGTNLPTIGVQDLDGNARIASSTIDRGAYEFAGAAGVGGPVQVISLPQSVRVCTGAGEAARFIVTGENNPDIHYTWEINAGSGWLGTVATNDGSHSVLTTANSSTLIVSNLSLSHHGTRYRFRITSSSIITPFYPDTDGVLLAVSGPTVLYVRHNATGNHSGTNWANAFTNLTAALANAASCSEIWVAAGTYRPLRLGPNSYAANLKNGVEIYGGFNGTETLRSERNWTNNATILRGDYRAGVLSALGFYNPISASTVVDGFIIQADGAVSGLAIVEASPTIRNCRFENLLRYALPIAVSASPRVENCAFINNRDTAIDVRDNSAVTLSNVLFLANSTEGQGAAIHSMRTSSVQVTHSTFTDNAADYGGGAILNQEGSTFSAFNCVFTNNSARSPGGAAENIFAAMAFTNCLFARNHSDYYGGALANFGDLKVVNCTVADNSAIYGGSGLYQLGATSTVQNTILWGNTDNLSSLGNLERAQIENLSGTVAASYSIIQGLNLYAGNANVPYDPLFVDAEQSNFRIQDNVSPAANAGDAVAVAGISTDLQNYPRNVFGVDMGAYESLTGSSFTPVRILAQPQSATNCVGGTVAFTVVGAPGSSFNWLGKAPGNPSFAFISGPPYTITSDSTSSTLTISNVSGLNGYQFRFRTASGSYYGEIAALTVDQPSPIYVRANAPAGGDGASWATAFSDLPPALASVSVCHPEVWIAAGTYRPTSGTNQSVSFDIPGGARIYGGFAGNETLLSQRNSTTNLTILSGDIGAPGNEADNSGYVVMFDGLAHAIATNTVLDGVTVQGGTSAGLIVFQASPTIRNCVSRQNRGSGVNVTGGSPQLTGCSFILNANSFGGGANIADASPAFLNCVFSGNTATNAGGGLHAQNSTVNLTNCLTSGNVAPAGAGFSFAGGLARVINCTVAANSATGSTGAGLYAFSTSVTLANSLLWYNAANGSRSESAQLSINGSANVFNNGIQNLTSYGGPGSSSFNPLLAMVVAPEAAPTTVGNYRLQSCSPALNAASGAIGTVSTDLDGNPRSLSGVDLGAYEYQGATTTAVIINQQPSDHTYCAGIVNFFEVQLFAAPGGTTAQWEVDRHNGYGFVEVTDGGAYSGAATTKLTLANATLAMHGEDYRLRLQTPLGCVAYSETARLTVQAPRLFVRADAPNGGDGLSWATALNNLRNALLNNCALEIWVAAGSYTPAANNPWESFEIRKGLAAYGGFAGTETNLNQRDWVAHPTILEGNTGAGASLNLVLASANVAVTNSRLDGFIIQNAQTGLRIESGPSLTVENCTLRQNQHGAYLTFGDARFVKCDIVGNNSPDYGAGLIADDSTFFFDRCSFRGNQSYNGEAGASIGGSTGEFANCVFSGNSAFGTTAMFVSSSSAVTLRNCTVTGNRAAGSFGGIYGAPTLINTIVWNNIDGDGYTLDAQIYPGGGTVHLTNSCVQALNLPAADFVGAAINSDPLFVQPISPLGSPNQSTGNLNVMACSPVIDAGNTIHAAGSFDLAGNARVLGGGVDIGAFESLTAAAVTILSQPVDQYGASGNATQFAVTATGTNLVYQWERNRTGSFVALTNDANYNGVGSAVLTVNNLAGVMDNDQFRCRIQNLSGCIAYSATALLRVIQMATATTLAATSISAGAATLNGSIGASGPTTYYFQYGLTTNYSNVTGTNAAAANPTAVSVGLNALLANTTYHFRAVAQNPLGMAVGIDQGFTTTPFFLTAQPTNATVADGATATFSVSANVAPATLYQWQRRAPAGGSFQNIIGATNANYTTPSLSFGDNGTRYRAQVVNGANALTSAEALATVIPIVQVTLDSQPQGLRLLLNSVPVTTPHTFTASTGTLHQVEAPTPQSAGAQVYQFDSWSDAGARVHNMVVPGSDATFSAWFAPSATNGVAREYWLAMAGTTVADLTSNPAYPNQSSGSEVLQQLVGPTDWADNYGARIRGYVRPSATGSYTFTLDAADSAELWLSTNSSPAGSTRIVQTAETASAIAQELFDYSTGAISGRGSAGGGWNGNWSGSGNIVSNSLSYTDSNGTALASAGNSIETIANNVCFRDFSASYNSGNPGTYWLSFVAQVSNPGSGYAGLSLFSGGTEQIFIGQRYQNAFWGMERSGSGANSTVPTSQRALLVVQLELGGGSSGSSNIRLWVNPLLGGENEPSTASANAQLLNFFGVAFNRIRLASGIGSEKLRVDEFRFGTSYAAVAPKNGASSAPIALNAGQDYYFDLLHKAGLGADRLSVRWTGPGLTNLIVAVPYLLPLTTPTDLTSYDSWRRYYFPGLLAIESLSGPGGDFFGDGIPNVAKYALGMNPTAPDYNFLSHGNLEGGLLSLIYRRDTSLTDLQYQVRVNDNLGSAPWSTNGVAETILDTAGTVERVKASVPTNGLPRRYLQLQLRYQP